MQVSQAEADGTGWLLLHRRLVLARAGFKLPARLEQAQAKGEIELKVHRQPTRKEVLGAVARTCRYPKCLMTGDPEAIVRLLDARKAAAAFAGRRTLQLTASFGLFRNRSQRRRQANDE